MVEGDCSVGHSTSTPRLGSHWGPFIPYCTLQYHALHTCHTIKFNSTPYKSYGTYKTPSLLTGGFAGQGQIFPLCPIFGLLPPVTMGFIGPQPQGFIIPHTGGRTLETPVRG